MAQYVDYWSDNVQYVEGPFVLCGGPIGGSNLRIECASPHRPHPVVVHMSIYELLEAERQGWRKNKPAAVDWLNELVRTGRITLQEVGGYQQYVPHKESDDHSKSSPDSSSHPVIS